MCLQDQLTFPSTIKRWDENTTIHNIFIFNKSGICFYGVSFTNDFRIEKNLLSPFITALMSFSKEMIGKDFKTIEMGDIKIVIFEKESLFYSILCDSIENVMLLDDIISKINDKLKSYVRKNKIKIDTEVIYDQDLNKTIETIIYDIISNEFSLEQEEKIINYLKNLNQKDEIDGVILLTDRGKVIYSSFSKESLNYFLKEIEFRVKICNNSILKLFYTFKNRKFIFSDYIDEKYFIILLFDEKVKFGLAEYYLNGIVNSTKRLLAKIH